MAESEASTKSDSCVIDSGCNSHMTFDCSAFSTLKEVVGQSKKMGTGAQATVAGIGDSAINACVDCSTSTIKLNNVLHIPSFGRQFLSVAQTDRRGLLIELKDGKCIIRRKDNVVATGTRHGALYILDAPNTHRYNEVSYVSTLQSLRERLAHVNPKGILHMVNRRVVKGANISNNFASIDKCECRIYGKGHQAPIPKKSTSRYSDLLELVQYNVLGPVLRILLQLQGSTKHTSYTFRIKYFDRRTTLEQSMPVAVQKLMTNCISIKCEVL